jgi:hypothetical protein
MGSVSGCGGDCSGAGCDGLGMAHPLIANAPPRGFVPRLEHVDIFQQCQNADHDHDDLDDLFRAPVDRQHIDEIEDQDNDQERDQNADEYRHGSLAALTADRSPAQHPNTDGT